MTASERIREARSAQTAETRERQRECVRCLQPAREMLCDKCRHKVHRRVALYHVWTPQ